MTNYKLVPLEPTPEMIGAAREHREGEAYLPVSVYKAMLAAAPAVQGEPVELDRYDAVFLGGQDGMPAYVWHDIIRAELDRAYDFYMDQLDRATPQPAPDVAGLVEALQAECEELRKAIRRLCDLYVVDDYYYGDMREEELSRAVERACRDVETKENKV